MDKIWDRNPSKSEVIGCCGGDEKTEWPSRTDKKSNAKKIHKQIRCMLSIRYESDVNLWKIWDICTNNKQTSCV